MAGGVSSLLPRQVPAMTEEPRRTMRVYRFRSEWGGKLKLSKSYLPLDQSEAMGAVPVLSMSREISVLGSGDALCTSAFLRNVTDEQPD